MLLWQVTACVVLLSITRGKADISVIPEHFIVEFDSSGFPSNNLTLVCSSPPDPTIKGVTFLQLRKYHLGEDTWTPVALLTPYEADSFKLTPEAGLMTRKYNLTGEINTEKPFKSFLRVEFYDSYCTDEGMYECNVHFHREGATESEIVYHSANISTQTLPEQVLLAPRPVQETYVVNQTVELHCSGQVGSPPFYFRWRYRRRTGLAGEEDMDFKALTFGVTTSEGPYPQGFCKQFRTATLWLRTELDLNGVEIRCLPVRGLQQYDSLSASFIFTVKEASCRAQCRNGGECIAGKCHCPAQFTGAFCEQAVESPCGERCDGTSVGSVVDMSQHRVSVLLLLVLSFHL